MSEIKSIMIKKISEGLEKYFNKSISELGREELFNYIKEKYVVGYTYYTISGHLKYINATLKMFENENIFLMKDFGVKIKHGKAISKQELHEYVKMLDNPQDKFIMYALYNDIYGKNAEDLLNIKTTDIDLENGIIKLKNRDVIMDSLMKKLVEDTLSETTYYIVDTGNVWNTTEFAFNMNSPYLIKQRPSTKNNNGETAMSYNGFRTRMKNLFEYLDSDLNITDVVRSGYAYRVATEMNKVTVLGIRKWLKDNNLKCSDYKLQKMYEELYK